MLKVLIALDGSVHSPHTLDFAATLLGGQQTATTVLHVIPRHLIYGRGGPVVFETYDPQEERVHAQTVLDEAAQSLQQRGVGPTITKELEVGDPADLVLAAAEANGTDLIIMGSRGLNAAERFLMGSVSTKVVTHAPCAVLVARQAENAAPASQ